MGTRCRTLIVGAALPCLLALTPAQAAASSPPATLQFNHNGTKCASTSGAGNLPSGMSQTGIAYDPDLSVGGTTGVLLISCWGDTTITAVDPKTGAELNVFTITGNGVKAFGALAYDRKSHTLWTCGAYSTTRTTERNSTEVGTINLSTGTYARAFTSNGCINGLAVDPGTAPGRAGTLWASANIATTIYDYSPSGALLESHNIAAGSTVNVGFNSGIAVGGGNLYLANPQTTTKRLFRVDPAFSQAATQVYSTSKRLEDLECDDVTYAPQTVMWVQWFNQNILMPLPISGTCNTATPPPPAISISQDSVSPVTADQSITFTLHAKNTGLTPVTGVTVTDTPPTNTILGNISTDTGSCSGSAPITCTVGTLAGGASATITVTVTPIAPGTATNQASATSDQAGPVTSSLNDTVNAEAGVDYVTVGDGGFTPSVDTASLGSTVQFNAFGGANREVVESLGLYDTGVLTPVAYARNAFNWASGYTFTDTPSGHTMSFKSPPVGPATGSVGVPFTVTWALSPLPLGFDEDVQVQYPGTTTWVGWAMNQTGQSGSFTPTQGAGTYKFRARIQKTGGTANPYGSPASVSVS